MANLLGLVCVGKTDLKVMGKPMTKEAFQRASYVAFLKAIRAVGLKELKKSTIFGSNDIVEEEQEGRRKAA